MRRYDESIRSRIRDLKASGMTGRAIAAELGVSAATVSRIAGGDHRTPDEVVRRIRQQFQHGLTPMEISMGVGVRVKTVRRIITGKSRASVASGDNA